MAFARIRARGRITLPRKVREEAQIGFGDTLNIHVVGTGKLAIEVLPRLDIKEFFDKYCIEGPIDLADIREEWRKETAERMVSKIE